LIRLSALPLRQATSPMAGKNFFLLFMMAHLLRSLYAYDGGAIAYLRDWRCWSKSGSYMASSIWYA